MEEKIKHFDEKLETYEDYNIVIGKFVRYLLEGITGCIVMFIPIQEFDRDMRSILLSAAMLSFFAISSYFGVYSSIQEKGTVENMYKKLRYFPVDVKSLFLVRLKMLYRYCKIKLIIFLVIQSVMTLLLLHTYSVWNVLYPVIWVTVTTFLAGLLFIYPFGRKGLGRELFLELFDAIISLLVS